MKIREYLFLVVGGAISLVLALVAIVFLVRASAHYRDFSSSLQSETEQWEALRNRSPYPNESNVRQAEENLRVLESNFDRLLSRLARGQQALSSIEPAQWPLLRQQVFGAINEAAFQSNVVLPERFAYGFDRYARVLPESRHLPRLLRQVNYVEQVMQILLDAKVHEIQQVDRHAFEEEEARQAEEGEPWMDETSRSRGRRRPRTDKASSGGLLNPGFYEDPDSLYERERMVFSFKVRETSLWAILNALSNTETFCVVSRLLLRNPTPPIEAPDLGSGAEEMPMERTTRRSASLRANSEMGREREPGGMPEEWMGGTSSRLPGRPIPREERVAAGRDDLLEVELEIDFYRFNQENRKEEASL